MIELHAPEASAPSILVFVVALQSLSRDLKQLLSAFGILVAIGMTALSASGNLNGSERQMTQQDRYRCVPSSDVTPVVQFFDLENPM